MQNLQKTWTSDFEKIVRARPQGHVLAVCLHPALDVTVYTENGTEISRTQTLGGKAINLSRMMHALGAKVTLLAPDDHDGQTSALLSGCGFDCELIKTNLSLRQNYKYVDADGTTHEQNENAGVIFPQHYQQLIHRIVDICRSEKISHVSLCGSFPQGVAKGVYKYVIEQLHTLDIPCVSDASGEALSLAIQAKPQLIKPNFEEFCTLYGLNSDLLKTQKKLENAVFDAYTRTQVSHLCSMDKHGAIYAGKQGVFTISPPIVQHVCSFAGAGDTMLAAFIYAHELCRAQIEDSLRFSVAAATAKVRLPAGEIPTLSQIYAEWVQTEIRKGGT
jgi:1-phosphofructokinase